LRFLMVDIGAGTMDVLWYDTETDLHYKAVVKSPVRYIAEKAAAIQGNLIVTGCEMGGGPITGLLKQRAGIDDVVMTSAAAATLHHDPEMVTSWGIKIVDDDRAEAFQLDKKYQSMVLEDLEAERLRRIVEGFGVPFEFDAVVVCAQDHGVPPPGQSHLDFRHNMFTDLLATNPYPHALLFEAGEVPPALNRLGSLVQSARSLPTAEVFVMDSGMAAMLEKLPIPGNVNPAALKDQANEQQLKRQVAIINSMTPGERRFPKTINGSRKKRIAAGSGLQIQDVNRLLKQFTQMEKMMRKMSRGGMKKMMRGMPGGGMPPGMH